MDERLAKLQGHLIVSCQALPHEPLHSSFIMGRMARAAAEGGALGILIGTFILGVFTKVANTFGAVLAFIAASAVMVYIKYFVPADAVSIWSYSIISIAVSLVVGIPTSLIWRAVKNDKSVPDPYTTIYKN